jgi:DNA-directed RNA polymerase specialized sigma24 family protein
LRNTLLLVSVFHRRLLPFPTPIISIGAVGVATQLSTTAGTTPEVIALDRALHALNALDPTQERIIELRHFGGLTIDETAEVLGSSPATVKREWAVARAWLHRELTRA